jgi:hypothetical protein
MFKAWDNKNKIWRNNFFLNQDGDIYSYTAFVNDELELLDATLCRSTLFKDKNDKVIWQSDIIMVNGKKDLIRQIIWDDETCSIMMQPIPRQPWIYDLQPLKKEWIEYINRDIEIIGNVFENKNLLETKNDSSL